jgi:UDPglucose 6-dehydrogenase
MKISLIGSGYVGLVTGACFAEIGHDVICADISEEKIALLNQGKIPFYEPGLKEIVERNIQSGRLKFTTNIKEAIEESLFIFIAVGTPPDEDGSADLQHVLGVAQSIGDTMTSYKVVVNKSTVPVGTATLVQKHIKNALCQRKKENLEFDVVSNPEFLKEGDAISDFMRPDRIVVGANNVRTAELMRELYAPFVRNGHPFVVMDVKSSELTKYAANAMLASRISFMNELSGLCEKVGADIEHVRQGIGKDSRIGMSFLYAGLGYGGSCFPKDVKALVQTLKEHDVPCSLIPSIETANETQRARFLNKILAHFGQNISNVSFALWGLSFKPKTDDIRESAALFLLKELLARGAKVNAFDPEGQKNTKALMQHPNLTFAKDAMEAASGAHALILATEWAQFKNPNFEKLKSLLKTPLIFDGRNQYEPQKMSENGWHYVCVGRGNLS